MAKVLILEDEVDYREVLRQLLCRDGHEVETVGDSRSAIEVARWFSPELLVADVRLAEPVDGLEVADSLQRMVSGLATILITAYCSDELRERARNAGVLALLQKPFDVRELCAVMRQAGNGHVPRIAQCGECGISLPLLRARLGEEAGSWTCAFCGARYRAVLDPACPPETLANVRSTVAE